MTIGRRGSRWREWLAARAEAERSRRAGLVASLRLALSAAAEGSVVLRPGAGKRPVAARARGAGDRRPGVRRRCARAFQSFQRPVSDGGVLVEDDRGHVWIEEYLVDPPSHILNGFIWALWGVYDYARWSGRRGGVAVSGRLSSHARGAPRRLRHRLVVALRVAGTAHAGCWPAATTTRCTSRSCASCIASAGIDAFAARADRFEALSRTIASLPRSRRSPGRPCSSCATTEADESIVRILFFTHYFPPEVNAPANRTHEHCREWVAAGHEVHVVTCIPSHPFGSPFPGLSPPLVPARADRRHPRAPRVDLPGAEPRRPAPHAELPVVRPDGGVSRRCGWAGSTWRSARRRSSSAPSATWAYTRLRRAPWVFELRDLWPESIAAVGAMRQSLALRAARTARDAHVSRRLRHRLRHRELRPLARRPEASTAAKLHFVPNGIVPAFWHSARRVDERKELGLEDADVLASYVGTIGMAHGLSTVLAAAARLQTVAPGRQAADRRRRRRARGAAGGRRSRRPAQRAVHRSGSPREGARDPGRDRHRAGDAEAERRVQDGAAVEDVRGDGGASARSSSASTARRARRWSGPAPASRCRRATSTRWRAPSRTSPRDPDRRARMALAGGEFVDREFSRRAWAARYVDVLLSIAEPALLPSRLQSQEGVASDASHLVQTGVNDAS